MSDYQKKKALQEKKDEFKRPEAIVAKCEALRDFVDNLNKAPDIALRGGIFQAVDPKQLFGFKHEGWAIGYQLIEHDLYMTRKCFIKAEQPLNEIPDNEKDPVVNAAMDAFLDKGQGEASIEAISPFAIKVTQTFVPLYWVEKNPNIVVPGGKH